MKALLTKTEFIRNWPLLNNKIIMNGIVSLGQNLIKTRINKFSHNEELFNKHKPLGLFNFKTNLSSLNNVALYAYSSSTNKFQVDQIGKSFEQTDYSFWRNKTWTDYYTSSGRKTLDSTNVIAVTAEQNSTVLHIIVKDGSTYYDVYEYSGVVGGVFVSENTFTLHSDYQINPLYAKFTPNNKAYVVHTGTQIKIFKFAEGTNHTNRMTTAPAATYTYNHTASSVEDMFFDNNLQRIVIFKNGGYDIVDFTSLSDNQISGKTYVGTDKRFFNVLSSVLLNQFPNTIYPILTLNKVGSNTHACVVSINPPNIELEITIIAGGGGGGAGFSNGGHFIAGGGGGGGEIKIIKVKVTTGSTISCVVGLGGVGGLTTGGGDGDNSSVTVNGTTYTALGGKGASNGHGGNSGNGNVATDRQTTGTYRNGGDGGGYNQSTSQGQGELLDLNPFDGTNDTITPNGYAAGGKGGTRLAGRSGDESSTPGIDQPDGSDAGDNTGCGGGGGNNGGGTNPIGAGGDGGSGLIAIKYLNSRAKSKSNVYNGYYMFIANDSINISL